MDSSNIIHSKHHYHQQHNSGLLMRYNSAPTSLLTSLIDNNTQSNLNNEESFTKPLQKFDVKPVKQEIGESVPQNGDYCYGGSELIYQGLSNCSSIGFYGSFDGVNSKIVEDLATLRELGSFKANEVSNGTLNFSSRPRMPQIAENGVQSIEANCGQTTNLVNENGSSKCHIPSFTNEFWDNSSFNAQKTEIEDEIMFSTSNGMESQEAEFCYQNLGSTHHLSLPSSSTKISSMEKFLQVQGSVPCKIRAKRGFAKRVKIYYYETTYTYKSMTWF
ncbi:unnamed protein product [Trifolium pratense]|uniref:Uncharacterized protein n=1 Tax=Trifolium pratense TaxID=57577 RepID=A0ACB0J663_TRIPR|nr:unnamed protein product [Trifolium pratense]